MNFKKSFFFPEVNQALAEDTATKIKNGTGFVGKDGAIFEFEQERCQKIVGQCSAQFIDQIIFYIRP